MFISSIHTTEFDFNSKREVKKTKTKWCQVANERSEFGQPEDPLAWQNTNNTRFDTPCWAWHWGPFVRFTTTRAWERGGQGWDSRWGRGTKPPHMPDVTIRYRLDLHAAKWWYQRWVMDAGERGGQWLHGVLKPRQRLQAWPWWLRGWGNLACYDCKSRLREDGWQF